MSREAAFRFMMSIVRLGFKISELALSRLYIFQTEHSRFPSFLFTYPQPSIAPSIATLMPMPGDYGQRSTAKCSRPANNLLDERGKYLKSLREWPISLAFPL